MKKNLMICFLLVCCVSISQFAVAQSTRAGELAAKQAEKAKAVHPYKLNKAEALVERIQGWGLLSLPNGLYPFFGSAYSGGGIAVGAGYRGYYADNSFWDVHGAWSIYNYRMLDASVKFPDFGGALRHGVAAHYVNADKVSYFGIGNNTLKDDEVAYTYNPITVEYRLGLRPGDGPFLIGGKIAYEDYKIDSGNATDIPSIEEEFNPITAPGLGIDPTFLVGKALVELDYRQSPGYTTSGGDYKIEYSKYMERNDLNLDFQRVDVTVSQFIPILRANQVIALRAIASFTDVKDANVIPFYLLPNLGGGEELRGFSNFRFADTHRMLLTAEYRWTPSKFIDMAIFYETGKVASRTEDLDFSDLHDTYGIGIRFHTPSAVPLRVDFAHSDESSIRIIFSGGTSF